MNAITLSAEALALVKAFESYLITRTYKGKTLRKYVRRVSQFMSVYERGYQKTFVPADVTEARIMAVFKHQREKLGRSDETLRDESYAVRAFFNWQHDVQGLPTNPAAQVIWKVPKKPSDPKSGPQFEHPVNLKLNDDQNRYVGSLVTEGHTRQDVIRRIIEDHRDGKVADRVYYVKQEMVKELRELHTDLRREVEDDIAGYTGLLQRAILRMQAFSTLIAMNTSYATLNWVAKYMTGNTDLRLDLLNKGLDFEHIFKEALQDTIQMGEGMSADIMTAILRSEKQAEDRPAQSPPK